MDSVAHQRPLVKASLFQFITKYLPAADLNVIDDIVLSYVIAVLDSDDSIFDVNGFIEMMTAYVPDFGKINARLVCAWVLEVEMQLQLRRRVESGAAMNDDNSDPRCDKITLTLQALNEMLPSVNKNQRAHSDSESSDQEGHRRPMFDGEEYVDQCRALQEMFPNSCAMEIKHCISIADGDAERAAATLLHRREQGQSITASALHSATRTKLCDDNELKSRIIARYSYVDQNSTTKEHKPLAPKIEPKKMVRYRDNKIVSLKGERYTEVTKSGIDEEHLKKPKKQHCP